MCNSSNWKSKMLENVLSLSLHSKLDSNSKWLDKITSSVVRTSSLATMRVNRQFYETLDSSRQTLNLFSWTNFAINDELQVITIVLVNRPLNCQHQWFHDCLIPKDKQPVQWIQAKTGIHFIILKEKSWSNAPLLLISQVNDPVLLAELH